MSEVILPAHMQYPGDIWQLADAPNPILLENYLLWLAENEEALASAADSMQWLPVGLNALTVGLDRNPLTDKVDDILQLNFYHKDQPGNEDPHAHSRNALTTWYAPKEARQVITRHMLLPAIARRLAGVPVREMLVVPNCIIDYRDGRRPGYNPLVVGSRLILENSVTNVAPLGSQSFGSLELHHIGFEGSDGVAMSVHRKGKEESPALSSREGLIEYKGLTEGQAEEVEAARAALKANLGGAPSDVESELGPVTMLFKEPGFTPEDMEAKPTPTPLLVAEMLIYGGLTTASTLAKAA